MIKSRVLNIAIFVACVLFFLIISNRLNNIRNKCFELEKANALRADSIKKITSVIENVNIGNSCKVQNCSVKNTLTNESVKLSTLFDKSLNANIIYRLIDTSCSSCNKKQIEILNYLQRFENLIVLSNASNSRRLRLFSIETKIKSPIYQLESSRKLFHDDDNTKVLVMYVNNEGTILRAYHLSEDTLFLIKHIVSK